MATTGSSSSVATPEVATGPLDLLVGLPLAAPHTAAAALASVRATLAPLGPDLRWQTVIAAPGADTSGPAVVSADAVQIHYHAQPSDALQVPYHGLAARARAVHALFREAHAREARACVVIDPRAMPASMPLDALVRPILDDTADLVTPVYDRHPSSGAIVHGLVYPLFRAVYGARLRYPLSADLACGRPLIEAVIDHPIWETDAAQVGIDLWLAATAASGGFRLAQAHVGERVESRADLDLGAILSQVVGFCCLDMERRAAHWQRVRGSRPVPTSGEPGPVPPAIDLDVAALAESFRVASRELGDVWAEVLPPLAVLQWRRLATTPLEAFHVDEALWARTVYDFAMGHRLRVMTREHLIGSLAPLYLAWFASFVRDTRLLPPGQAEEAIERLCLAFETEKPYLVSQWRWPERFKPVKRRRVAAS
jgi:glucosylglycerate synthase